MVAPLPMVLGLHPAPHSCSRFKSGSAWAGLNFFDGQPVVPSGPPAQIGPPSFPWPAMVLLAWELSDSWRLTQQPWLMLMLRLRSFALDLSSEEDWDRVLSTDEVELED